MEKFSYSIDVRGQEYLLLSFAYVHPSSESCSTKYHRFAIVTNHFVSLDFQDACGHSDLKSSSN